MKGGVGAAKGEVQATRQGQLNQTIVSSHCCCFGGSLPSCNSSLHPLFPTSYSLLNGNASLSSTHFLGASSSSDSLLQLILAQVLCSFCFRSALFLFLLKIIYHTQTTKRLELTIISGQVG